MRSKTSTTRSVPAPPKDNEPNPFFNCDSLFDDLKQVFTPIGDQPPRYRKFANYSSVAEIELDFKERRKRVNRVLNQEFDPLGIERVHVWMILGRWWNPADNAVIEELATAMVGARKELLRDIKRITTIQRVAVKIGPLPIPVRERFVTHRDRFLDSLKNVLEHLNRELSCYQQAIQRLKRAQARTLNRRPRTTLPTTGTTVRALHQLLSRKIPQRLPRALLIHSLLSAWNQQKAPASPETIRTGYR